MKEKHKRSKPSVEEKVKLLGILTRHVGRAKSISLTALYEELYGKPCTNRYSMARGLRRLITVLRKEGIPVCSTTEPEGGGYYLAAAGSELENYCKRLRIRAIKILKMEANLIGKPLPDLLGQIIIAMGSSIEKIGGTTDE